VEPVSRSRVNECPNPAILGRGLNHETHKAHGGADHPKAQDRRAGDRPGRRPSLPRDRGGAADLTWTL